MDAFSAVLSEVKLTGAVFFSAEFSAPWGFSTSEPKTMAAKVAPGAAHLVLYHLVIEGGAYIELADSQPVTLGLRGPGEAAGLNLVPVASGNYWRRSHHE